MPPNWTRRPFLQLSNMVTKCSLKLFANRKKSRKYATTESAFQVFHFIVMYSNMDGVTWWIVMVIWGSRYWTRDFDLSFKFPILFGYICARYMVLYIVSTLIREMLASWLAPIIGSIIMACPPFNTKPITQSSDLFAIGTLRTNFNQISVEAQAFSFEKVFLKSSISSDL